MNPPAQRHTHGFSSLTRTKTWRKLRLREELLPRRIHLVDVDMRRA